MSFSQTRVAAFGDRAGHSPKYSIWEGSPDYIIAHEIGHDYVTTLISSGGWSNLPHWKQEGLLEYIANSGLVKSDTALTLQHRIELLDDYRTWSATQDWHRHGWDKIHYEAWLLIEYIFEIKKLPLEQIIDNALTKEEVSTDMPAGRWVIGKSLATSKMHLRPQKGLAPILFVDKYPYSTIFYV